MDDIVAQWPSVLAIHDDVFIYGKNNRDHNANIINLFNMAQKGLIFNSKKCAIKQEFVTFFGKVFSAEGYSPDLEKIQGISKMTPPQMKQELQSFLGTVNYLQMFVPHLSSKTEPLQALLKKENCFAWDKNTNMCFQKIKSQLQESPHQTPEILWLEQTGHPPVWCLTQGARSLHHTGQTAHCFCKQVPHRHWDPLCQHQERTLGHCIWLWKIPHITVCKDIHHGDGP